MRPRRFQGNPGGEGQKHEKIFYLALQEYGAIFLKTMDEHRDVPGSFVQGSVTRKVWGGICGKNRAFNTAASDEASTGLNAGWDIRRGFSEKA